MLIQHSWDFPETPVYQYSDNNAPQLPNIQVSMELSPYLGAISAQIANTAGAQASASPVRMYCYNTLAYNGWVNQSFSTVFKLVCDMLIFKFRQGLFQQIDYNVLCAVVDEVIPCYASAITYNNPNLLGMLQPALRDAVINNYRTYNEMVSSARSVNGEFGGNPSQPVVNRFSQGAVGGQMMGNQGMMRQPPPAAHPALQNTVQQRPRHSQFTQGNLNARVTEVRRDTPATNWTQGRNQPVQPQPVKEVVKPAPEMKPVSHILQGEGSMDKAKHRIAYHNVVFPTAQHPRENSKDNVSNTITKINAKDPAGITEVDTAFEVSLCSAIQDIHTKHSKDIDLGLDVYLHYVNLINPIISPVEITPRFSKLAELDTFASISRYIQSMVIMMADPGTLAAKKELVWVGQFDRIMTDLMNNWLHYNLGMKASSPIDSFLADSEALPKYILSKYGATAINSFNRFQNIVMESISKCIHKGTGADDIFVLADVVESGAVDYNCVCLPYAVYYFTELAEMLDYNIGKEAKEVSYNNTPKLHKLIQMMMEGGRNKKAARYLIVTADDVRYEFYESATMPQQYFIREV